MSGDYLDRLSGSPHDIVNPNGLAFVILTALPLLHFLCTLTSWGTLFYLGLAPPLVYALILTSSRSGLLGLVIVLLGFFYLSRHRVALLASVIIGFALIVPNLSPEQRDRYRSIFDDRAKNAPTVELRMEGIKDDVKVIFHKPFVGHGLGTSREANVNIGSSSLLAHNLYIEVGQELGLCGLAIFLCFMGSVLTNFLAVRKALEETTPRTSSFLLALANGGSVWLAMNILFSFFSYGLHGYEWYLFGGLSVVLNRLSTEQNHDVRAPKKLKLLRVGPDSKLRPDGGLAGSGSARGRAPAS
jgi:O-antigen ligase